MCCIRSEEMKLAAMTIIFLLLPVFVNSMFSAQGVSWFEKYPPKIPQTCNCL